MTSYSVLEAGIVGAVVLVCLLKVFGRFAPRLRARVHTRLGNWAQASGHPAWLQNLGRKLAQAPMASGHCGSGCNTCGSCEPQEDVNIRPVRIERHRPGKQH